MRLKDVWYLIKQTASEWMEDRAMSLAASLSLYTLLSLAPVIVLAVSVAGLVFGEEAARGEVAHQLHSVMGAQASEAIQSVLAGASAPRKGILGTIVAVVILLVGASGVFSELQDTMNIVWNVKVKSGRGVLGFVRDRFFSFAMVLGVAFLLLVSLVLSAGLTAAGTYLGSHLPGGEVFWQIANFIISFLIVACLFGLIFKVVPDAKIQFRDVWHGALVTAFLFALGKLAIGYYLGKTAPGSAYGAAGSLVALIVWVYYSAQILFFGAEFTQVYAKKYGSGIVPTKNAVAVESEANEPTDAKSDPKVVPSPAPASSQA
ncbi:YihY/virulence factor BrkB family protein [soil metagenome]